MSAAELDRVLRLAPAERLELIGRLWDSLADEGAVPDLFPEQTADLDRRLDRLDRDGSAGLPWPEARRRIERGEDIA